MSRPYLDRELEDALRRLIDARRRELEEVVVCPIGYGTPYGYRRGCRCDLCRAASAEQKRKYRSEHPKYREAENARRRQRHYATD